MVGQDIEIQYARYGSLNNPVNRIVGAKVNYVYGDVYFDVSLIILFIYLCLYFFKHLQLFLIY